MQHGRSQGLGRRRGLTVFDSIRSHVNAFWRYESYEFVSKTVSEYDGMASVESETQLDQPLHPPRLRTSKLIETPGVKVHHCCPTHGASREQEGRVS